MAEATKGIETETREGNEQEGDRVNFSKTEVEETVRQAIGGGTHEEPPHRLCNKWPLRI